jgi:hypothetical protein
VELADPSIIAERGEQTWNLLNPLALMSLDALREKFGPIVVNGLHNGHNYTESGLRRSDTATGSKWSIHKFGGAFDCKPRACTVKDVYDYVLAHPDEFPHINRVENIAATPTWYHFDVANAASRIQVVNP